MSTALARKLEADGYYDISPVGAWEEREECGVEALQEI
jgi:hypothetical protein